MTVTVRIPTQLRSLAGGDGELAAEPGALREVLDAVKSRHTELGPRIFDDQGQVRRFINVFVDEEDIRFLDGLDTKVTAGQTVSIVPAVAGG